MERNSIKYYFDSFQKAKKQGILREYLFWLQLKQINSHGRIMNREKLKSVASLCGYSNATISALFKKTIQIGFIDELRDDAGIYAYQLSSYKKVLTRLKYRNIVSDYKYTRITIDKSLIDPKKFKCLIQSLEIQNNFKEQGHREKDKLKNRIDYCINKGKTKNKEKKLSELTLKLNEADEDLQLHRKSLKISCKGIAKLLGYKTASFGNTVESRIAKYSFGEIINNGTQEIAQMSRSDFKFNPIKFKSFWLFGKVFSYRCNNINFTLDHYIQKISDTKPPKMVPCIK